MARADQANDHMPRPYWMYLPYRLGVDERRRLINALAELQRARTAVEPSEYELKFQIDKQLDAARSLLNKLNDLDHITDEWNLQAERMMGEIERGIPESVIDTRSFSPGR